ncbi:MAG: recombinase family protein [Bacteroidota bacterium]|nr:recombinase family protein [Bacteroidota bacterium]
MQIPPIHKNVIKYRRVSTDEQSTNYSFASQNDIIDRFLNNQESVEVHLDITDDASGKNFKRPGFIKILEYLKNHRAQKFSLVFIDWDRFTRAPQWETYNMINILHNLNCSLYCVFKPMGLDFDDPDEVVNQAITFAIPAAERLRIRRRTMNGTRQALKQGYWCNNAPYGYKMVRENHKSLLTPNEKAPDILRGFQMLIDGNTIPEVINYLKENKVYHAHSNIYTMFRNVLYCGQVKVPALKDESEIIIEGKHQPIVSREIFQEVQDILDGKRRKQLKKHESFPLKGILLCPTCGKMLRASFSTGRHGGKFGYYHCIGTCKTRHKIQEAHNLLTHLLGELQPTEKLLSYYKMVLEDTFKTDCQAKITHTTNTHKRKAEIKQKLQHLDNLLLEGGLKSSDYYRLQENLKLELTQIENKELEVRDIEKNYKLYLDWGINLVGNLDYYYSSGTLEAKSAILGSIFPEKLIFEQSHYRTPRLNNFISLFRPSDKELQYLQIQETPANASVLFDGSP